MSTERIAFLALHFIPGIGSQLVKQLVSYCGSAEDVFKTSKGKLLKIPGIGSSAAGAIKNHVAFHEAEKEWKKAEKSGVDIQFFTDKRFPSRLKVLADGPSLLYIKGNVNLNQTKTVGIVGTRQATEYGRAITEQIIEGLVPHQAIIVSGLAYGIDIHAHKCALKNSLPTVGIMGSGIDVIYPAVHRETAARMLNQGGLVTENHFGTKPDAHNFPARNRIIAGLSDALLIIEAASRGGALITAEIANTYNKDVFAVPGNVGQIFSEGCNQLIKTNKAHLLVSAKDIEYIMNWVSGITSPKTALPSLFDDASLSSNEQKIIKELNSRKKAMLIDELSYRTDIPLGLLSSLLLTLEFNGYVVPLPGKQFRLC